MASTRADIALVARGIFDSRAKAQDAIAAGLVTADGRIVRKASARIPAGAVVCAEKPFPWVSRGGVKLAAALDAFGLDPRDRVCLDVGASTGGFTDVLLSRGARQVHAVDVGRAQLHARLKADVRVVAREGTDIRKLAPAELPAVDLAVIDVSFISLRLVLPAVVAFMRGGAGLVALIKPQFEAGREKVRKGIVRDAAVHAAVCEEIVGAMRRLGLDVLGVIPSPIEGGDGNREFLVAALKGVGGA